MSPREFLTMIIKMLCRTWPNSVAFEETKTGVLLYIFGNCFKIDVSKVSQISVSDSEPLSEAEFKRMWECSTDQGQ